MKLSPEHRDHYWQRGWVVVEGVFPANRARAMAALAETIARTELAELAKAPPSGQRRSYWADQGESGELAPRKIVQPFTKHPDLRALVSDPALVEVVQGVTGDPPVLLTDQILLKPPRFGAPKPYHQDNAYFRCTPADSVVTAWIALDDVDVENGCLRYIDGSHHGGLLPHEPLAGEEHNLVPSADLVELKRESTAPVRAGGVVLHHPLTLHTSYRNESPRWRRGYASHWATRSTVSDTPIVDNAYFRRPELQALTN